MNYIKKCEEYSSEKKVERIKLIRNIFETTARNTS